MTPDSLHDFFLATASVAGALIGLLFVAISVEHERLTADNANQAQRVRASGALTAFTNALTVSLFALIPDVGLRWPAFAVSVVGLSFVVASLLSLWRVHRRQPDALRGAVYLIGLAATFVFQLLAALQLIQNEHRVGPAESIAVLVVVCFLIGIGRSWALIGGPQFGLRAELLAIFRGVVIEEDDEDDA